MNTERPTPETDAALWERRYNEQTQTAALCAKERDEARAQVLALREALWMSKPLCIFDILQLAHEALEHLFEAHSCDTHGHENWMGAKAKIPALIEGLKQALSAPPPPVVSKEEHNAVVERAEGLRSLVENAYITSCDDWPFESWLREAEKLLPNLGEQNKAKQDRVHNAQREGKEK